MTHYSLEVVDGTRPFGCYRCAIPPNLGKGGSAAKVCLLNQLLLSHSPSLQLIILRRPL